ncbi:hypothetical protein BU23DRAFT_250511, partial [Bimuria novae-zelandiae CBS 107.79]
HQTKAAEHARAERRRRNQRIVDVGGGPVYAGDCRKMAAERVINEAAKQEAAVAARHQKALVKQFNTWKRILSNVRNWGKRSSRRHREGLLATRSRSHITVFDGPVIKTLSDELTRWEYRVINPALAERFQDLYKESIQKLEQRGKFRARRSIIESSIPALEVAYVNGGGMDPYTRHLQQKGDAPTLSSFPEEKQAIIQVQDSQFHVHETQLEVTPIGSDDEGYSSPILEFYDAISPGQADWACER